MSAVKAVWCACVPCFDAASGLSVGLYTTVTLNLMTVPGINVVIFTAQCTLVHMRGLEIACHLSVCLSVCL